MYVKKFLQTTIDLLNPFEIYQTNIDDFLLTKLKDRYQKKCYQSMLILDILQIIRRSSIKMVDNRLDGGAYVDIQFEIGGIILSENEILHQCKIIEIHTTTIIAEHEHAIIKIVKNSENEQLANIIKIGDSIPLLVHHVRYIPNYNKISVIASLYTPAYLSDQIIYYTVQSVMSDTEIAKINIILDQIKEEEEQHKSFKMQKQYAFFKDILYPFKVNQKFEHNKIVSLYNFKSVSFNIQEIQQIDTGTIIYPAADHKSNRRFFWSKKIISPSPSSDNLIVSASLYSITSMILMQYLMYMQSLRGFMESYPTPASMKQLLLYWKLCQTQKR